MVGDGLHKPHVSVQNLFAYLLTLHRCLILGFLEIRLQYLANRGASEQSGILFEIITLVSYKYVGGMRNYMHKHIQDLPSSDGAVGASVTGASVSPGVVSGAL